MNKKITLTLLCLVCALCCAFGLAACDGGVDNTVKGTIAELPEHVQQIVIGGNAGYRDQDKKIIGANKNDEFEIRVIFEDCYVIGTMKMLINDTETALTPIVDELSNNVIEGGYVCKYTPTADFEITFNGEAKLAERKVTLGLIWFHYDHCQNDPDYKEGYKAQQRLLKEEIKNSVYVKVLVNDEVHASFNGITLKQYENKIATTPYITVTAKDKVEVRLYTTSAALSAQSSMIDGESHEQGNGVAGSGYKNRDELIENRFEEHGDEKVGYVKIHSCEVDEIITIIPYYFYTNDTPLSKTFALTDVRAYVIGEQGQEQPVPDNGVMAMAANLKTNNLGKTAICANDGKVTGTCDFGLGAFGELMGDEIFTLTITDGSIGVANNAGMSLDGYYSNGTLELSIWQQTDGEEPISYCLKFVFALQSAN